MTYKKRIKTVVSDSVSGALGTFRVHVSGAADTIGALRQTARLGEGRMSAEPSLPNWTGVSSR